MLLEQEYQLVDVAKLKPHPENPRQGDESVIEESIETNGFFGAVLAQRSSSHILVGNHRWKVAREKGATVIPVLWVDVDDDRARRIMLVENASNDAAGYDSQRLADVLRLLAETESGHAGTGFGADQVAEILSAAEIPEQLSDVDDAPDYDEDADPTSKTGDLWLLGGHRLVCGSATSINDVRLALGDRAAGMVFTDPPYGVDYTGGTKRKLKIANDDLSAAALGELLEGAFEVSHQVLIAGAAFYVCSPSGVLETTFRLALAHADLHLRTQIVWVKNAFVLGRADYHGQHETILYGWQLDGEPQVPPHFDPEHETMLYGWKAGAAHSWDGGRKQSTVWEFDKPRRSAEHPTMKPVDMVARAITNSTVAGAVVLDTFAGSGSTLIACHHTGRSASLVELDPKYVDVICRRFQEHTGIVPIRAESGEAVSFLEAA